MSVFLFPTTLVVRRRMRLALSMKMCRLVNTRVSTSVFPVRFNMVRMFTRFVATSMCPFRRMFMRFVAMCQFRLLFANLRVTSMLHVLMLLRVK